MNNTDNHTDITVVLDRSGSMASTRDDTIGGYNRFVDDQKEAEGTADITLNQFDTEFMSVFTAIDVRTAPKLTRATYVPRGNTAMLDAIGRSMKETGERLARKPAKKVIFVIQTDGLENASTQFTYAQIKEMIEHQRSVYSWQFVFLGANIDAVTVGESIGVQATNTMTYASNAMGTRRAFESIGSNLRMARSAVSEAEYTDALAFSAAQREEQEEAGVAPTTSGDWTGGPVAPQQ